MTWTLALLAWLPSQLQDSAADVRAAGIGTSQVPFSWLDVDGDGRLDAVTIRGGQIRLWRTRPDGSMTDATEEAGLAGCREARFLSWHDVDRDGDEDLFVGTAGSSRLFTSEGGVFVDTTEGSGLETSMGAQSARWLDYDADGRTDLYLVGDGGHALFRAAEGGDFQVVALPGEAAGSASVAAAAATVLDRYGVAPPGRDPGPPSAADRSPRDGAADAREPGRRTVVATSGPDGSAIAGAPATNLLDCVNSLADQSGGGCVQASSVPLPGHLYPLGPEFFIDSATGRVGVGTVAPSYALEVAGQIVSGTGNDASGLDSAVGGGLGNTASATRATVAGGEGNQALAEGGFIGGGLSNLALSERASIVGGVGNRAAYRSAVGGGDGNAALGNFTTVGGGKQNEARQTGGFVGGGELNVSDATHATVAGGTGNSATGANAAVGGGSSNLAIGAWGAVPGGRENVAAGAYAFAAGRRARAMHDGSFVWGDSTDADVASTGPDQFVVRAARGMGVGKVPDPSFQLDVEGILRTSDTIVSTKAVGAPFSVASSQVNAGLNADLLDGLHASAFSTFGASVDSSELADGAVTSAKLAAGSVGASAVSDDAITANAIASGAVGSGEVLDGSLTGVDVQDGALTEADVSFGQLTVDGVVESMSGGFRFPDGTLQTTAGGGARPFRQAR